ncbi:DUF6807 family protein [Sunxiuqinia dokdonensis]|nr:DUF6807 family protein [Sunxiuqinia dokdonensis]
MNKTLVLLLSALFYSASAFAQLSMERTDDGILLTEGDKKIAFYKKEAAAMNLDKGRNNYFHPVYLPDGTLITEDAPADHIHHRGIFWAWHQLLIDGEPIGDQWELREFIHDVKSVEFFRVEEGMATLKTIVNWNSPAYEGGEKPFVQERVQVNFYEQRKNYRIIQFEIELKALVENVELGGSDDVKGYGGFSVRANLPADVTFTSDEGVVLPQNEAVEAGNYINMSGSMAQNSRPGGVLIYSANEFETANDWILRSENSMQNAVWPGRKPVALAETEPTVLRYALVLYSGEIKENRVLKTLRKLSWD